MTDRLAEIEARHKARTPGRYYWSGNTRTHSLALMAKAPLRPVVLDFGRWGMHGAQPRFRNANGVMVQASAFSVPDYTGCIKRIAHPDAIAIEHSWEDVDYLLAEVKRLRAQQDGMVSRRCHRSVVEENLELQTRVLLLEQRQAILKDGEAR